MFQPHYCIIVWIGQTIAYQTQAATGADIGSMCRELLRDFPGSRIDLSIAPR